MYKNCGSDFFMESLREIFEKNENERKSRRGSVFVTMLIILIIAFTAVFYLKTSEPMLFEKAKQCIMTVISDLKNPPPPDGSSAAVLRSADTLFSGGENFEEI